MAKRLGYQSFLILLPVIVLMGFSLSLLSAQGDLFFSQLFFYLLGLVIFFLLSKIPYEIHRGLAVFYYPIILFLLFLTFFSPAVRGSSRWLDIFGFRFQPSELVKPLLIVFWAGFFSKFSGEKIKNLLAGFFLLVPVIFLIFKQPDLGTAILVFSLWLGIVYFSGLPTVLGILGSLGSFAILPLLWNLLKDYQRDRILSFLNPYVDPSGAGYHSIQAMIAVGSGNFLGKGLGEGSQSQLNFLPEHHTDFIFASLVESLGFLGGIIVILAYAYLLFRLLKIARDAESSFAGMIVLGTFCQVGVSVFINIGMNMGLLPITGITLPLLSYGGSSIFSFFISLGIVANIAGRAKEKRAIDILS